MEPEPKLWVIVLAMGEEPLGAAGGWEDGGDLVPSPRRAPADGSSPLARALDLATALASRERSLMVVSAQEADWWRPAARRLPADNVIVQPCDRGSACSVLLPVLHVLPRDPDALLLITRADHHVRRQQVLRHAIQRSLQHLCSEPDALVLLGLEPEGDDDPGWGWIDPGPSGPDGVCEVVAVKGAQGRRRAEELLGSGALWNSLTFVIRAALLEALFESAVPWLPLAFGYAVRAARRSRGGRILERVYRHLPRLDLSDVILHGSAQELRVLPVPPCGWTHVGRAPSAGRAAGATARCPDDLARPSPAGAAEDIARPDKA